MEVAQLGRAEGRIARRGSRGRRGRIERSLRRGRRGSRRSRGSVRCWSLAGEERARSIICHSSGTARADTVINLSGQTDTSVNTLCSQLTRQSLHNSGYC